MKKVQIQEIISLSSFIMVDPEYTIFTDYIRNGDYTSARLFLDTLMSKLHDELEVSDTPDQTIIQYERCNQLEDLVLDLIIGDTQMNDKRKNTRRHIILER